MSSNALLTLVDLRKWYRIKKGIFGAVEYVRAVDGVSSVSYTHLTLPTN